MEVHRAFSIYVSNKEALSKYRIWTVIQFKPNNNN